MDPITTAILAAIAAGLTKGAGAVGGKVLVDAYDGLKAIIKRKFGHDSELSKAVDAVEAKPDSAGRKETLKEEIVSAKADQDPEILKAAQTLLDQLGAHPGDTQYIQQASGSYIGQAQHRSTVTINAPDKPKQ